MYRGDKTMRPVTPLPTQIIGPMDGWCDTSDDAAYNQPVRLPYPASTERLRRKDRLYDMIVVLGHNDDPVIPGLGSAIFMHVARPDFGPTLGCIALALEDLRFVLRQATHHSTVTVHPNRPAEDG